MTLLNVFVGIPTAEAQECINWLGVINTAKSTGLTMILFTRNTSALVSSFLQFICLPHSVGKCNSFQDKAVGNLVRYLRLRAAWTYLWFDLTFAFSFDEMNMCSLKILKSDDAVLMLKCPSSPIYHTQHC